MITRHISARGLNIKLAVDFNPFRVNSAKIKPRQHILAFPVYSDMSGSYWVRVLNMILLQIKLVF